MDPEGRSLRSRPLFAALLPLYLACCLLGCSGTPGDDGGAGRGKVEDGRIELPAPEPVPGLASDEWSPPPVWLVSGGRIVQGSYGEFCKLDDCTGMETPEQMGEDLASMRASGKTFVVIGSNRVSKLAAGEKDWDGQAADPPVPGVYTEPGVPPDLRRLEARRVPEGARPVVEPASGIASGETTGETDGPAITGTSVFELASTGEAGDRRLSVFLGLGEYDRAVYHWRLDPGRAAEVTSSKASSETTSATLEELTPAPEETTGLSTENAPDDPEFRDVGMRSVGESPTGVATGEGHVWVLDRDGPETSLLKLNPDTGETLSAAKVPDTSSGLDAGAGAVWLLKEEAGTVLRLDPASGRVERRVRVGGSPAEVVAAETVWVAVSDSDRSGRVVGIDPRTSEIVTEIKAPGAVESVAVDDASGDVWAAIPEPTRSSGEREGGQLLRIDPAAGSISERLAVPGGVSDAVVGGGAVWALDPDGDLLKIDPEESLVSGITPLGPPGPREIEFGTGAVWIASVDTLARVNPATGDVSSSLEAGPYGAQDLAVGERYVWTVGPGDGRGGTLTRVTP